VSVTRSRRGTVAAAKRAVVDVRHLVRFRIAAVRRRSALRWALAIMGGLTLAACTIPMALPGSGEPGRARDVLLLLPTAFAAFLMLTVVSAVASGGGRELLSREQGVAFPVSPTTDHLGALLMAPLNIAWLLQAWVLLGSAAYALSADRLPAAVVAILLWLAFSTAVAQVVAWTTEALRRGPHGIGIVRLLGLAGALAAVLLHVSGRLSYYLDHLPTVSLVARATDGFGFGWLEAISFELAVILVAVVAGAVAAHAAARRAPRDEARVESGRFAARRLPATSIGMIIRVDRSSVWRSVPMRRGIAVLAIGPGAVAIAGDLPWHTMTILPGLVASGGALLFGVNAWCLDGRGLLWRESLPARPAEVFAARAYVLAEFLVVASLVTILLASLRAGIPNPHQLAAIVCMLLVVTVQVVNAALRWSAQRPYPVDLRSARAVPAPPLVMVGYSSRLALSTTMTGLVFSGLSRVPDWRVSVLVAIPFLAWSTWRLVRVQQRWLDPVQRSAVVVSVAA
jgi:hypothetical protein